MWFTRPDVLNKIPLSVLRNFEAAGRNQSFKAAADELGLTPGAVSHSIAKLEDALGVELFTRTTRATALSPAGEALLLRVSRGFEELQLGLEQASTRTQRLLRLHAAPSFAAQFLAPRLPAFLAANPGLDIRLATGIDYARFKTDEFDADIIYGKMPLIAGLMTIPLGEEHVTPLCTPEMAAFIKTPTDLLSQNLIQSDNKQIRWPDWFNANGIKAPPPRGLRFDRSFLAIRAAVDGQGLALESTLLAQSELTEGRLVAPLKGVAQDITYTGHHFVYPVSRQGNFLIKTFLAWLLDELHVNAV
ncbi:MAG TPA: LysR substrate-binding domain-containing protein [Acidocella sp.]|nr:MAG: LysR family transcriptional regulator [Acidocella sp. 20-61-6]HQT46704.1 LysR substrate-binding domain-containing protein [Acidocella sp.]